jgi:hypothetical protein
MPRISVRFATVTRLVGVPCLRAMCPGQRSGDVLAPGHPDTLAPGCCTDVAVASVVLLLQYEGWRAVHDDF